MKKVTFILVLQLFIYQICAQSISEKFGGIRTNFEVFSDTINLKVTDQIVIITAERKSYINGTGYAGWGYGYQSIHFEFITQFNLLEFPAPVKKKNKYKLTFSDQDNVILQTIFLPDYSVVKCSNPNINNSRVFYSIDLIHTPILLLDKTKRIEIKKLN